MEESNNIDLEKVKRSRLEKAGLVQLSVLNNSAKAVFSKLSFTK